MLASQAASRDPVDMTPDPKHIRPFKDAAAFEAWLSQNHQRQPELWLKIHKQASGLRSVTCAGPSMKTPRRRRPSIHWIE